MSEATSSGEAPGAAAEAVPGLGGAGLVRLAPAATLATVLFSVLAEGVALVLPALSATVLDRVVAGRAAGWALAALAGLLVLRVLAEAGGGVARVSAVTRVSTALRYRLVRHVFAVGIPIVRRFDTGDLVARVTGNAAVAGSAVPALVSGGVAVAASAGGTVALWWIDWRIGAVFLAGVAPAVVLLRLLMGRVTGSYAAYQARLAAIAARLTDALAGARTIRASGTTEREIDRVLEPLPELSAAGATTWTVQRAISWQMDLIQVGVRIAVLAVAGLGLTAGRLSPGEVLAAAMYLTSALGFLYQVDALIRLSDARANNGRVVEVLTERPVLVDLPRPAQLPLPPGPGALSLRGVRVRLGDRTVLDGVDLEVPAGAAVAVVGRSGAGKSTLALTIGRLVPTEAGQVLIDGVPVTAVATDVLNRAVGYAFDRPVPLGERIRDAVGYGRPELTDPQLWQALRMAQAADFVRRLPGGLDAPLAGAPFSGGELQRLGLARAIAHGGRILVLDDATSSLDTATEALVTGAITKGLAGRTRLVVAHRTGTAARADLVAWLDAGRIRAVAPHAELWRREAAYRAVFADPSAGEDGTAGGGRLPAADRPNAPDRSAGDAGSRADEVPAARDRAARDGAAGVASLAVEGTTR